MSDVMAGEPGWSTEAGDPELFPVAPAPRQGPPSPPPASPRRQTSEQAPPDRQTPPDEETSSSRGSSSLAYVVGKVLETITAGATIFARRRLGLDLDLKMTPDESIALGRPIASLLGRKIHVRGHIGVISDSAETAAGSMNYFERVLAEPMTRVEPPRPAPTINLQGVDVPRSAVPMPPEPRPAPTVTPPYQAPGVPPIHDPNGAPVPGAGPTRQAYLAGFGDD